MSDKTTTTKSEKKRISEVITSVPTIDACCPVDGGIARKNQSKQSVKNDADKVFAKRKSLA